MNVIIVRQYKNVRKHRLESTHTRNYYIRVNFKWIFFYVFYVAYKYSFQDKSFYRCWGAGTGKAGVETF